MCMCVCMYSRGGGKDGCMLKRGPSLEHATEEAAEREKRKGFLCVVWLHVSEVNMK